MIALTQEKREELIERAKYIIQKSSGYEDKILEMTKQLMEIAIASLTAEPSFTVLSDSSGEDQYTFGVNKCTKDGFYELYAAPPVPEIKLPEKLSPCDMLPFAGEDAWNKCIDEIKRLNGLGE